MHPGRDLSRDRGCRTAGGTANLTLSRARENFDSRGPEIRAWRIAKAPIVRGPSAVQISKAVITAAGRGARQYPASDTVQKAMLPAGRSRRTDQARPPDHRRGSL